ncbi:unnamed protein product [Microthlaspi erraticum]|uniref:Pectinesterase n=1 Tax=Microthlaspi erraticum TaxID=1685480 RepID=A0A6D2IDI8_9BRAS|nr:unnamed protein product [Microthlaspi erraticum]
MDTVKSIIGYFKVDEAQDLASKRKALKRLFFLGVSVAVLVAIIICVAVSIVRSRNNDSTPSSSPNLTPAASLRAVCSMTQFPDSCISSISKFPSSNTTDPEVLFRLSLKVVVNELASISYLPKKLAEETEDERLKSALSVCEGMLDDAMDSLNKTVSAIEVGDGNSIIDPTKIDDLKTWLTAALTYHETCFDTLDEPSPDNKTKTENTSSTTISQSLKSAMQNSTEFTSSSLAIVAKCAVAISGRESNPNVTVAADGSGDVETITEAVLKVPTTSNEMFVIYVKSGTYVENIFLDKSAWNVMIYGDGRSKTIISGNKNCACADDVTLHTYQTPTFSILGKGFKMKNIGIINTAGPEKHQAVAFQSQSDNSVYYQCSFDGYQDTLYTHSNRQFYRDCDVTGTVDFIFGNAAAVFQDCTIRPRQPLPNQFNAITAQGRSGPDMASGIVIQRCTISANGNVTAATYFGRPWKKYSTTVYMESEIGSVVEAAGWMRWDASVDPPTSILYGEYKNWGPGSGLTQRVKWAGYKPDMSDAEVGKFTVASFILGSKWLPATGVPYQLT